MRGQRRRNPNYSHTLKAQRSQGNLNVSEKRCLEGIKIAPGSPLQERLSEKRADCERIGQ